MPRIATIALLSIAAVGAHAAQIAQICDVQGVRGNTLRGIGLVVGLSGTGDQSAHALQAQEAILRRMDIEFDGPEALSSDNSAVVIVTATLPAFAKEGTRIDVEQVSSWYDAESLEGGILLSTYLSGEDNEVYAVAQGPVSVGGFNADAVGANARQNHVTVGRIPQGAYVEREVPSTFTDGERTMLLMRDPDFINAKRVQDAINDAFGAEAAEALGAGAIAVRIPAGERDDVTGFIAQLQELDVEVRQPARVVVNERTGTIVVGGDVAVQPCQVAHGNITITVQNQPIVIPPAPFNPNEAAVVDNEAIDVEMEEAHLMPIQGTTAQDVAQALNALKVTPRDMIAIFQAIRRAGALEAELEIM